MEQRLGRMALGVLVAAACCVATAAAHAQAEQPPAARQPEAAPVTLAQQSPTPTSQTPTAPTPTASAEAGATTPAGTWDFATYGRMVLGLLSALGLFLAGTAVLLYFAGKQPDDPYICKLKASFFFWLGMGYTVLLLTLAVVYTLTWRGAMPYLFGGVLPIGVPWFGALGAVTISLEGVFQWNQRNWKTDYNYWHMGRPLFGAVLGIVAFFLFVLIVSSSGTTPPFLESGGAASRTAPKDFIIYYVVAFLVGYREETFRELIRRVTDMILKPVVPAADAPEVTLKNAGATLQTLEFSATQSNTTASLSIEVQNTGKAGLIDPTVTLRTADQAAAAVFTLGLDQLTGTKELAPGGARSVELKFTPQAAATKYAGTLVVTAKNLATPATLPVTGSGA